MYLNQLKPAVGSKKKKIRIGRGMGSGFGKTCGFGHKGQKARSGYSKKIGFEGGQLPLYRRLPKFGFTSLKNKNTAEVLLKDLNRLAEEVVTLEVLKKYNLIAKTVSKVKIILSGELEKKVTLSGLSASKGVKGVVEKLGGRVE